MGISIENKIEALENFLALLKTAHAKYPDLYFSNTPERNGVTTSRTALDDCDQITFEVKDGRVYIIPYVKIGDLAVVGEVAHGMYVMAWVAIERLRNENPEAHRALVAAAKDL